MAVSKKITKKVIGKKEEKVEEPQAASPDSEKTFEKKRVCYFCQNKLNPTYTDLATLKKYVNERGKIVPRIKSGICSRHQRAVTRSIKYARHLALLPFTSKV